jgi:hypothetical protein
MGDEYIKTEIENAVKAERERIAQLVDDFSWILPMFKNRDMNIASDDAAEAVKEQIAAAIRAQS